MLVYIIPFAYLIFFPHEPPSPRIRGVMQFLRSTSAGQNSLCDGYLPVVLRFVRVVVKAVMVATVVDHMNCVGG